MPSLAHYMTQYDHEHESGWNKFLHGVGIPMIFAGMKNMPLTKYLIEQVRQTPEQRLAALDWRSGS